MPELRGLDALLFIAHSQAIPNAQSDRLFCADVSCARFLVRFPGTEGTKFQLLVGAGGGGGLEGPGSGNSYGSSPGSSSGRDGSPGSRTGGGISGLGFPGGLSRGGSVGCPGVIGGSSVGSIGIASSLGRAFRETLTVAAKRCSREEIPTAGRFPRRTKNSGNGTDVGGICGKVRPAARPSSA